LIFQTKMEPHGDGRGEQGGVTAHRNQQRRQSAAQGGRTDDRDVDDPEVLGPVPRRGQYLGDQRLIDGQVGAETRPVQDRGHHRRGPRLGEGQQQRRRADQRSGDRDDQLAAAQPAGDYPADDRRDNHADGVDHDQD
jgi:hypothetical protein